MSIKMLLTIWNKCLLLCRITQPPMRQLPTSQLPMSQVHVECQTHLFQSGAMASVQMPVKRVLKGGKGEGIGTVRCREYVAVYGSTWQCIAVPVSCSVVVFCSVMQSDGYEPTPSSPVMARICSFVYLYICASSSFYTSVCINLSVYRDTSVPIETSIHPHVSIYLYILIFCSNSLGSLPIIAPSIARQKTHNF